MAQKAWHVLATCLPPKRWTLRAIWGGILWGLTRNEQYALRAGWRAVYILRYK